VRVNDSAKRRLEVALMTTVGGHAPGVKQLLEVARNHPYSHCMTESLDAAENALIAAINEISDDIERYQEVKELEARLDRSLKQIKADAARRLYEGRSWNQVGKLLGVTGSRAEQISRASR
jgi:7-keto-8-aminopelargonate synthetase-like enzyme